MEARQVLQRFEVAFEEVGDDLRVKCPFHDDEHPSGYITAATGRYRCKACQQLGDVFDVIAQVMGSSRKAVLAVMDVELDEGGETKVDKFVDAALVERWHRALLANQHMQRALFDHEGINLESIKRHRLGLAGDRIAIPVYNGNGGIVNVRQRHLTQQENKVINIAGHGKRRLYPITSLEAETIYIVEGELKALLLLQLDLAGLSPTGGARTWPKQWGELFKGKHVVIIYDIDKAGREGAQAICRSIAPWAASVKNVLLPLSPTEHPKGGIEDYLHKLGHTAADLAQVVADTPPWKPTPLSVDIPDNDKVHEVALSNSSCAQYYNQFVKVDAVVSAKDTAPFIVPRKYKVTCLRGTQPFCGVCPISTSPEEQPEIEIGPKNAVLLELINTKAHLQQYVLKRAAKIPHGCSACAFGVTDTHNIEEIRLIPQLKIAANDHEHVVRRAFYVGHGIETNTAYALEARCIPEPNTQYATLLAYEAKPSVDSLSKFTVTDEVRERLKCFQCESTVAAIDAKLAHLYADLERNVTRIYGRRDMHLAYDIVYHSPLYVSMQGRTHKGWMEALVIGDSCQGKSEAMLRLAEHYQLGERVDCKQSSIAGLLGGLQETARRWFVSWGVITLNDRRLVALEEVKGLHPDVIAKMTDARSSGIVEVSKIEKAKTTCRCRLVWISNPRTTRPLSTYNYGVEAVKELIGSLEDIRRFDFAMAVRSGDVPSEVINTKDAERPAVPHTYTAIACRELVLWAWSRRPEQIQFDDDAVTEILSAASAMSSRYSSAIPLVEPGDQWLKLTRASAALAARLFSTTDGIVLRVTRAHVLAVVAFLDRIYSSTALGYLEYSQLVNGDVELPADDEKALLTAFGQLSHPLDTIRALLDMNVVSASDLMDLSTMSFEEAKALVGLFVRKRALKRYRSVYIKTPAFIRLLKKLRESPGGLQVKPVPAHIQPDI